MLTFKRPTEVVYQITQTFHAFNKPVLHEAYYGRDPSGRWWRSEKMPPLLEAVAGRPPMVDVAGMPMPSMICTPMDARQAAFFLKNYWPKLEGLAVGEESWP